MWVLACLVGRTADSGTGTYRARAARALRDGPLGQHAGNSGTAVA